MRYALYRLTLIVKTYVIEEKTTENQIQINSFRQEHIDVMVIIKKGLISYWVKFLRKIVFIATIIVC